MPDLVVIGGADARDAHLVEHAQKLGWTVSTWGFRLPGVTAVTANDIPVGASVIGPVSGIDGYGWADTEDGRVRITPGVLARMGSTSRLAAGVVAEPLRRVAETEGITVVGYRTAESFAWQNAALTAEAAIAEAIGASGFGLMGRPMVVLGYGRVGEHLALRLYRLGCRVRVLEADPVRRARAQSHLGIASPLTAEAVTAADIVFNTIPHPVITPAWERVLADAIVFELASPPGGVAPEVDLATVKVRPLPGLPGKTAPKRAAEIIWETVWPVDSR